MNVKDLIELLKQYPEDMEVWSTWDESGEFFPKKEECIRKVEISYVDKNDSMCRDKPEWISNDNLTEDYENDDKSIKIKKDVVLESKKVLLIT